MGAMPRRAASLAALALLAAPLAAGCSPGLSYPHAYCGPLIAQFHAKESRQAYLAGLAAVQKQGAPVAALIKDETVYARDAATAAVPGTQGFGAVADAPAALGKVAVDLRQLNAACGQPADAYKSDNA
jgi:hypothetical protein